MLEAVASPVGPRELWPYPEDEPEALPTITSLRVGGQRRVLPHRLGGQPIGIAPAFDLHDLAIVATVLEAAKFQAVRRQRGGAGDGRLIISAADLRRYRRRPEPGAALVLVLDHSCRRGWDWTPGMAPYLRWAYHENAAVTVIEFGHRETKAELSAERYRASSLSDPQVLASLDREPGLASPLAYALDLAVHELRRFLRRGRAPVDDALLLVRTDGRGNVPLDASVRGRVIGGVGRLGVTDAVAIADTVATLPRTRAVVVAPDVDQYADLPFDLAEAMAGLVILAPRLPDTLESDQ